MRVLPLFYDIVSLAHITYQVRSGKTCERFQVRICIWATVRTNLQPQIAANRSGPQISSKRLQGRQFARCNQLQTTCKFVRICSSTNTPIELNFQYAISRRGLRNFLLNLDERIFIIIPTFR